MNKNIIQSMKIVTLALVLSVGISYVSAWTAPTATPPGGNVAAPLNTSSTEQTKAGPALFNGAFNPLRLSSNWSGYTLNGAVGATNHAEIANDVSPTYNALMIAGNKSGDLLTRKIKMYDDVEVNRNLSAGNISANSINVAGTIESTSGGVKFPDGTVQTTAASSGGTLGVKAFVNFNGAACTPWCPMGNNYGVSGVLRTATGQYTVNFSTPMNNANYAVVFGATANGAANNVQMALAGSYSTGPTGKGVNSVNVTSAMTNGAAYLDSANLSVLIFAN